MFQIFRRIGFFRRRWVWALLLIGLFGLAGYWMVPWHGASAELQLVALRPDGSFAQELRGVPVRGPAESTGTDAADTTAPVTPAAASRRGVPLVLAVANSGVRSARPERLILSMPRWYRLVDPGPNVRSVRLVDEPLQQYIIEAGFPVIESGRVPTLLPVDTLWLEPWVPDYYCTADADSIPGLMASSPPDTSGMVPMQMFYSFEGMDVDPRQTGLLTVQMPGEMFRRSGPQDISDGPVEIELPQAQRPAMGALAEGGGRYADCGPPGDPMRIYSALWLTPDGGRMISVHYGGQARKEYYDLNGDSIIELEMWDPDGDGEVEAWRRLRVPIPEYMLPEPPPAPEPLAMAPADSFGVDSLGADSLAPAGMAPAAGGPLPDLATLSRQLMPGDLSTARPLFVRRAPSPQPDDGLLGQPIDPTGEPAGIPGEPGEAVEAEPEPEPEPAPPPARRRNVPLGEPVD